MEIGLLIMIKSTCITFSAYLYIIDNRKVNGDHSCNFDFLVLIETGCATPEGWQLAGESIDSGIGHADDVYLVLSLELGGLTQDYTSFRSSEGRGKTTEIGRVSFVFELQCSADCALYFFKVCNF